MVYLYLNTQSHTLSLLEKLLSYGRDSVPLQLRPVQKALAVPGTSRQNAKLVTV